MKLDNKVAVVTGAGTGMGRAIAELFAQQGAKVVVNYARSRDAAVSVVEAIQSAGGTAIAVGADVSKEADAIELMAAAEHEFGRIDYLVNNAGWSTRIPHAQLSELSDEIWDHTLNVNLRGVFYCVRAAVPYLKRQEGSSIVNISSVASITGQGSSIAYAASKAGVVTMTKSLARALAPGIRVNVVLPGFVRTRFAGWPKEQFDSSEKITPLRRLASVEDVAEATLFFAAVAKATTGESLVVDGGMATLGPSL
ncbi:MAG TPA: glucose 1-dehydrogenase [Bryobacteraceae bacterium]|nr:glucose 1-dehydrogenase [Bryobacteraceae bacterium]